MVVASGVNFSESVATGAEFCFSSESSPSSFERKARSISNCDQTSTPIAISADFLFFRADAIFPFKPESSIPITISALSLKL